MTSINGIENVFKNMTSLTELNFRVDKNELETANNPGKLKNLFNQPAIYGVTYLTINLS